MNGIQKTVAGGLRYLANKVEEGFYGVGDDCCQDTDTMGAFEEDLQDEVMGKTDC